MVRVLFQLLIIVLLSLSLLLYITYRGMGPMTDAEALVRWSALVVQDAPSANFVKEIYGTGPPQWAMRLSVAWERANVLHFWWLPLVLLGALWLVNRSVRRRSG